MPQADELEYWLSYLNGLESHLSMFEKGRWVHRFKKEYHITMSYSDKIKIEQEIKAVETQLIIALRKKYGY